MSEELSTLLEEALSQPKDAVHYFLSRRLGEAFPDKYLLETDHRQFSVERYAFGEQCRLAYRAGVHSEIDTEYNGSSKSYWCSAHTAWQSILWEGHDLELLTVSTKGISCTETRYFLLGPTPSITSKFFVAVCNWNAEVRGEVLVWTDGWYKDAALFADIQSSRFESLVLEGGLAAEIRSDFEGFFTAKETYDRYGIPWKRGVLLLGPPGNGKTHCIKALVNLLKVPCLYVKTFARERGTEQDSIRRVFQRARESAPCLLVLEDLDTLLREQNRSFFLNEMDGFATNSGVMVVATTNHPERLDPAILERPSRFDRKYAFLLPGLEGRCAFLTRFSQGMEKALRVGEDDAKRIASRTDGFSYAYLKELYLSSMMIWIGGPSNRPIGPILESQIEPLRAQMHTASVPPSVPEPSEKESHADAMARYMSRWKKS